jgi:hypothetical protein
MEWIVLEGGSNPIIHFFLSTLLSLTSERYLLLQDYETVNSFVAK